MKPLLFLIVAVVCAGPSVAQERLFRCDNNYYTNSLTDPKAHNCKPLEGGNLTIVQGTKVQSSATVAPGAPVKLAAAPQSSGQPGQRVDSNEQRGRDSDARIILDSELKKAEARRDELQREYNNGEPERRGEERNYQTYLDRVSSLKASIARTDSDIAAIKREIAKLGP